MANLRNRQRTLDPQLPKRRFKVTAPRDFGDENENARFVSQLNKELGAITEQMAKFPSLDRSFNPDDYVRRVDMEDLLTELDEIDAARVTAEGEDDIGRRRGRRASRRRRSIQQAVEAAIENAVPTTAPPEVEDVGAVGTTDHTPGPTLFALSDHTHSGVNLSDVQDIAARKDFNAGLFAGSTDQLRVGADGDLDRIKDVPYSWPTVNAAGFLNNDGAGTLVWTTSGIVSSVAGGVGITNTPEPIVSTGTVDLDINSLTTETTVATGDLFAFVDVSVGTTPASQRKVTAGNIAAGINALLDHGLLAGLTDDDHAGYVRIAGRTGTTNDFTISTSTDGTITGSSNAGSALILKGGSFVGNAYQIKMVPSTSAGGNAFMVEVARDLTMTAGFGAGNAICVSEHGTWLVQTNLASGFGVGARGFVFAPSILNDANRGDMGLHSAFLTTGNVTSASGTTISAGATAMLFDFFQVGGSGNAGTLTWTSHITLLSQASMAAGTGSVALTTRKGLDYVATTGGTPTNAIAVDIAAEAASTLTAGVRSAITSGTGKWFLLSTATADSSLGGNLFVGSTGSVVPTATIHARHPTITSEVTRFESTTSGTPAVVSEVRRQGRVATTNATVTTVLSYTLTAGRAYLLEARVVGHRTGGAAGAADDSAAYVIYAGAKHTGGVAALITAVGADYTDEDQAAWAATIDVDGANAIRVRVTGAANNDVTWHCTLIIQEVGT